MANGFFITGTDTDTGKTWATLTLMRYFQKQGKSVVGMKPVASGCRLIDGHWRNDDALALQAMSSVRVDYELMNPYAYEKPVSPHLAGRDNPVDPDKIRNCFQRLSAMADIVLVEGAGGWYAPINDRESISDLASALALPIIVVVAIRLGCINHARLTGEAIVRSSLPCAGWIAVCLAPVMPFIEANIDTIKSTLTAPLLGVLPYMETADFDSLADRILIPTSRPG